MQRLQVKTLTHHKTYKLQEQRLLPPAGAIAAGSITVKMDKIINARAQADKIGVSLTETGGHFTAFNSLMAQVTTAEQDKQVADPGRCNSSNESCYRNTTSLLTQVVL